MTFFDHGFNHERKYLPATTPKPLSHCGGHRAAAAPQSRRREFAAMVDEGLTSRAMADQTGLKLPTVRWFLRKYGLKARRL